MPLEKSTTTRCDINPPTAMGLAYSTYRSNSTTRKKNTNAAAQLNNFSLPPQTCGSFPLLLTFRAAKIMPYSNTALTCNLRPSL